MRILTLFLCFLILGCDSDRAVGDAPRIYTAALVELAPAVSSFMIVSEKVTFSDNSLAPEMDSLSEYGVFTFPDLSGTLTNSDFPMLDVTLVSSEELDQLDTGNCETFWENFRSKYSRDSGYFRISDIGFSEDKKKAILYIQGQGGCLAGKGTLVIMEAEGDEWLVAREVELWVS